MIRGNVWSGPRNVSTALMYSFREHPDVTVLDEPLYGHWLRVTGEEHPGRRETLASMELDGSRVVDRLLGDDWPTPALVCKQMAHHLVELDEDWIDDFANVLLIRHPREVLLSYSQGVERPTVEMLGYPTLLRLLDRELAAGREPVVIDSADLLAHPAATLARMCDAFGLRFDPAMLSWPAGPKPEDGAWAPHWYAGVHRSTGFSPPTPRVGEPPVHLRDVLEQSLPLWERLATHARQEQP